ncbi:MAG: RNA polymerase sigma factor [Chitinophagaceae bacterium]|nr:MAG: RNA polymerase sigma factor [Chitinophagaceae bacterium]
MGNTVGLYKNYSDDELMRLLQTGRNAAFDELYERYGQKLFSYFFRMLWKNRELAEDFTQELFIKLLKNINTYSLGTNLSTWLYSIANNMCKNEYRKHAVRSTHQQLQVVEQVADAVNHDMKKFREAVHQCTTELPEEKKALYILRFQENLAVRDISEIMGIPEGTIKSRIFYLLKEMKEKLKAFESLPIYP